MKQLIYNSITSSYGSFEIRSRIINILSSRFVSEYKSEELENLVKMFSILQECWCVNENVLHHECFYGNSFVNLFDETTNIISFMSILTHLLKSSTIKTGVILDNILSYAKKNTNINFCIDPVLHKITISSKNREKMLAIMERIFLLPNYNIEKAVEKIIATVGFEILGHLFCESPNSIYFEKCTILGDFICSNIEKSSKAVTNCLLPSICLLSCSDDGKSFFEKCLEHKHLHMSINDFIKNHFKDLKFRLHTIQYKYQHKYDLGHIIYIKYNKHLNELNTLSELGKQENKFIRDYVSYLNAMHDH